MTAGDYLEGLAFFALMLGSSLGGALLLTRKRYPQLDGAARVVGFSVLATLGVLAVHLLPGALGVLSRGTVLAASALWLAGAWLAPSVVAAESPPPEPDPPEEGFTRVLASVGLVLLAVWALAVTLSQLSRAPVAVDLLAFHLPGVGRWMESGSIWQIDTLLPDVAPGNYPNNGDVMLLAAVLPWKNDFLAHFAMYPFCFLTGVAGYALARELRVPRPAAALAGCLVPAMPIVYIPALAASLVDSLMLFGFAAGALFLVRHRRSGATSELVLAGLALGLSFGTKWYAVSAVAVLVAVWAVASLVAGAKRAAVLRHGAGLCGLIGLAGGVWLVRNMVLSGNPVFPVKVAPLGVTIFDAPRDVVREQLGYTIAGYLDQPGVWWDYILPQYKEVLAGPALLLVAGLLLAAVAAVRRNRPRDGERERALVLAGLACAVLILVTYSITPYTAGGSEGKPLLVGADSRYAVPAFVVAVPLAAWAAARFRRGSAIFSGLALLAVADGLRLFSGGYLRYGDIRGRHWALALGLAALAAGAWWAAPRVGARLSLTSRRAALAGAGAVAALLVVAGGREVQQRYDSKRYVGQDPVTDAVLVAAGQGQRIGLAGDWSDAGISPVLPAFGPRYGNEVEYIGRFRREMLRRYPSRREFVAALRRGRYDFVIVGRGRPPRAGRPREARWALGAGYTELVASERLALYRR